MRTIEFRGKSKNSDRWVYGDLITNKYQSRQGVHIYEKTKNPNYPYLFIRVDKKTIGQYTGCYDKNGNKIYEGDILNSLYKSDGCNGLYVVTFENGIFYPKRYGEHQQKYVKVSITDLKWCEVIGNIYDNPELMGETK